MRALSLSGIMFTLICCAVTTWAAAPDAQPVDTRLSQKVTYQAKAQPVKIILADLSKMTGVTLKAGYSDSDWQVRDRRMNIFVKDLPLGSLMSSMKRVMRFTWAANSKVDPPAYRFYTDRSIILKMMAEQNRRQDELKEEVRRRRSEFCDTFSELAKMSDEDAEKLKEKSPYLYLEKKFGTPELMESIFRDIPRLKEIFINCEKNAATHGSQLSYATKQQMTHVMMNRWAYERPDKPVPKLEIADLDCYMGWELVPRVTNPTGWEYRQLDSFGGFGAVVGSKALERQGWMHAGRFNWPDSDSANLAAKVNMKAEEAKLPADEIWSTVKTENEAGDRKAVDEIAYYMMFEPLTEHADEPELDKKFMLRLRDKKQKSPAEMPDVAEALAETTGYAVVTDSFKRMEADVDSKEDTLKNTLDGIADDSFCNWTKHRGTIELSRRDWFRRRGSQIPDEWIEGWRDALTSKGHLTLDEFAQIVALDYDQIVENIASDSVLGKCFSLQDPMVWNMTNNHWLSKLYLRMNANQRAIMCSEVGINMGHLSPDQLQLADAMFSDGNLFKWDNENFMSEGPEDITLKAKDYFMKDGRRAYTFTAYSAGRESELAWEVKLPKLPPAAPADQKPAQGQSGSAGK